MANSPQAKKRARQAIKRRHHNVSMMSETRTYLKNVLKALVAKNVDLARTEYARLQKRLDSMVTKNLLHKNKVARIKSRLNTRIKAAS